MTLKLFQVYVCMTLRYQKLYTSFWYLKDEIIDTKELKSSFMLCICTVNGIKLNNFQLSNCLSKEFQLFCGSDDAEIRNRPTIFDSNNIKNLSRIGGFPLSLEKSQHLQYTKVFVFFGILGIFNIFDSFHIFVVFFFL